MYIYVDVFVESAEFPTSIYIKYLFCSHLTNKVDDNKRVTADSL